MKSKGLSAAAKRHYLAVRYGTAIDVNKYKKLNSSTGAWPARAAAKPLSESNKQLKASAAPLPLTKKFQAPIPNQTSRRDATLQAAHREQSGARRSVHRATRTQRPLPPPIETSSKLSLASKSKPKPPSNRFQLTLTARELARATVATKPSTISKKDSGLAKCTTPNGVQKNRAKAQYLYMPKKFSRY